ncbi:Oxygen regulatory protein NreC [subsurface metagenome]
MDKIFIADDHTIIRDGLRRIIEEVHGYKVVGETGDGLQILPLIRKLKPDIILLDISMPNLRGIEAIHKIRKVDKKVKILVLTMHKNEDYVYECFISGAQGYILKDDAATELMFAIESIKRNKTYVSPSFSSDVIKNLVKRSSTKRGSSFGVLTQREREVLKLIAEGKTSKRAAKLLGISPRTVEHHRLSIMRKLGVSNTARLIRYAIENGLVN